MSVVKQVAQIEGKNCNLETKNDLETAKFRGLEYFHNPCWNWHQLDVTLEIGKINEIKRF